MCKKGENDHFDHFGLCYAKNGEWPKTGFSKPTQNRAKAKNDHFIFWV